MNPAHVPVASFETEFTIKPTSFTRRCLPIGEHTDRVIRMQSPQPAIAKALLRRHPSEVLPVRIGVQTGTGVIGEEYPDGRGNVQHAEALLANLQFLMGRS